jgi:hypothetical protein
MTPWRALCVDLVGPYTLKGKDGSSIDFMCLTMIDPVFIQHYTSTKANRNKKATYQLMCSHGILVARSGSRHFANDDIGLINVVTQWLKQPKTSGKAL